MASCVRNGTHGCQPSCIRESCTRVPLDCDIQRCYHDASIADPFTCDNTSAPCARDCARAHIEFSASSSERHKTLFVVGDSTSATLAADLGWHWTRLLGDAHLSVLWPQHNETIYEDIPSGLTARTPGLKASRPVEAVRCRSWSRPPQLASAAAARLRLCVVSCGYKGYTFPPQQAGSLRVRRTDVLEEHGVGPVDRRACATVVDWMFYNVGDTVEHALELVAANDELLVNTGVHHTFETTASIRSNLRALLNWHAAVPLRRRPCLVWRETMPQHFQTPTGEYVPGLPACSRGGSCAPPNQFLHPSPSHGGVADVHLAQHGGRGGPPSTLERRVDDKVSGSVGRARRGASSPADEAYIPSQMFNEAAEAPLAAFLARAGHASRFGLARVYHAALPYWHEKIGCSGNGSAYRGPGFKLDCTHVGFLNSESYRAALCISLAKIRSTCPAGGA